MQDEIAVRGGQSSSAPISAYRVWQKIRVYNHAPHTVGPLHSIAILLANVVVPTYSGAAYKAALCRVSDGFFEWQCEHLHRTIREADKCSREKWYEVHG